jgi:2-polyprenyl-3-methyl-5-hydroxy-6-metoxy-1,4-benzoquinol methylase
MTATPTADPNPATSQSQQAWAVQRDEQRDVVFITRQTSQNPKPDDWRDRLTQAMHQLGVAIVGAKRLADDGNIASAGEFVIHPKGFHHLGKGLPATSYRFPEEVDAVAAGVLAIDAKVFDSVDHQSLLTGELGAIALCLAIREQGGRCVCVPSVVATDAPDVAPTQQEAEAFSQRFGFDWLIADLDVIAERYTGTPMLWNARFFGTAMPFEKYIQRPAVHWHNYANVDVYRQRADHFAKLISQHCPQDGHALDLGCGDGLFTHLASQKNLIATGLDLESEAIDQAKAQSAQQTYPGTPPAYLHGEPGPLPFDDKHFDLVFMLDVIEHLPNPVVVLRETMRVLKPGGKLLISTPSWQYGGSSDATYHVTEYTSEEFVRQVNAVGIEFAVQTTNLGKIGGVYRDLILIAKRAS